MDAERQGSCQEHPWSGVRTQARLEEKHIVLQGPDHRGLEEGETGGSGCHVLFYLRLLSQAERTVRVLSATVIRKETSQETHCAF